MAECIDREALEAKLNERLTYLLKKNGPYDHYTDGYDEAVSTVEDFPAAGAAPVLRGWWESVDSSYWRWTPSGGVSVPHITYRCSRCGRGTIVKTNYCPYCGAKMDKEDA